MGFLKVTVKRQVMYLCCYGKIRGDVAGNVNRKATCATYAEYLLVT